MIEAVMLGLAALAGIRDWPWWTPLIIGMGAGLSAVWRQLGSRARGWSRPPHSSTAPILVFGWAGLSTTIYLFAKVIFRGTAQ